MARIAGVDLPPQKRVEIALTYIYGIGRKSARDIVAAAGIDPNIRTKDLHEDQIKKIREVIESTRDRKSTRLNSSHQIISYAVFCLKKKKTIYDDTTHNEKRCARYVQSTL